jgi:hypothetical protein
VAAEAETRVPLHFAALGSYGEKAEPIENLFMSLIFYHIFLYFTVERRRARRAPKWRFSIPEANSVLYALIEE